MKKMNTHKIKGPLLALIMISVLAFGATAVSSTDSSLSVGVRASTVERKSQPKLIRRAIGGGRWIVRKSWNGTKWVSKRAWVGTKRTGKTTWKATKSVGRKVKGVVD